MIFIQTDPNHILNLEASVVYELTLASSDGQHTARITMQSPHGGLSEPVVIARDSPTLPERYVEHTWQRLLGYCDSMARGA